MLAWKGAREAGYPADSAEPGGFEHKVVKAAEQDEAVADSFDEIGQAAGIARAFLDAYEVGLVRQLREIARPQIHPIGRRVVVDYDR